MAATTETDLFILSTQYLMEPFGHFLHDQFEEFEKRLFLDNDLDCFSLDGIRKNTSDEDNLKEADDKVAVTYDHHQANYMTASPSIMSRNLSFSAVSEELSSIEQQLPNSNKRVLSPPLTSPRKHQAHPPPPPLVDTKEGILLKDMYGIEDFSAMGLVFSSEVSSDTSAPPTRSFSMHRSHSLGHLRSTSASSALDSTMQGLHASVVPSLAQLLEVKEDHLEPSKNSTSTSGCSIRRVCSTGDLQRMNSLQPEAQEEGGFKIGRYSLAERKERIHRYRQKRSERNFNKKIKYACRKTLADSRPRVRGRFAKNEDVVESPSMFRLHPSNLKFELAGDFEEEVDILLEDDEGLLIDRQSSGELSETWGVRAGGR